MRIGANYTPRAGWFHSWHELDEREVATDFAALAGIGLDHVRLFPLWPLLQPSRGVIVARALDDLLKVVDLAGEAGLQVSVDVLNGHLSSFDFVPSWATSWHQRNLFTDPLVVQAQARLVSEVTEALATRDQVTGICLGNEFAQFAAPRHPLQSRLEPAQADQWLETLLGRAEAAMPGRCHVHSFDDDIWFVDDHPFTPEQAVTRGTVTTVHSWVFGGVGPRFGAGHPALTAFTRYLLELAAAWAGDATRPVWLQEVGAPSTHVPADDAPAFLRETLLQAVQTPNLEAITWWCSHDVSRSLPDFPELEYSLGLLDSEGHVKPIGAQLAELLPDLRTATPVPAGREALDFDADPTRRSLTNPHGELFDAWLDAHLDGQTLALRAV